MIKQREIDMKLEEERKVKEQKDAIIKRRKELVKLLSDLCEAKCPGSNYDRFFVEEYTKKFKVIDELEEFYQSLS